MADIFKYLSEGGAFSLPFLVHIYDSTTHVYLVNAKESITYNGITYSPSQFTFSPDEEGAASLEIELVDEGNNVINIMDESYNFHADITGVMNNDGTIYELKTYNNRFGSATWDGKSAKITFTKDDRWDMTLPPLIFNSYNNRGNS